MTNDTFAELVKDAEKTLYHVAKTILYDDNDCADAVQEAVYNAFRKLKTLREEKYFKTWLVTIMIHECYKIKKHQKKVVYLEEYMTEENYDIQSEYSDLYQAIGKLPEELRMPIVLHYIEGFSVREVGIIMKIKEGTIKSRLSRARNVLKHNLEAEEVLL